MEIEFDPAKNPVNRAKHGLSMADFAGFDADPIVTVDGRTDYGEARYRPLAGSPDRVTVWCLPCAA